MIVQSKTGMLFLAPGVNTITLDAPVSPGNVLVAFSAGFTFNTPFAPIDNRSNNWQGPMSTTGDYPYYYGAWYATNVASGTTTVTFSGFDVLNDTSGTWVIILEVVGGEFDGFSAISSDPPDEEIVTLETTHDNDIIISTFGGVANAPPALGLVEGDESTLIDSESIAFNGWNWSVLVQEQTAGVD